MTPSAEGDDKQTPCPDCWGDGVLGEFWTGMTKCSTCNGTGLVSLAEWARLMALRARPSGAYQMLPTTWRDYGSER